MFKIETWKDNPILRKIAEPITKENWNKSVKLWKKMLKYIKNPDNWWIGLAAPQIWESIQLVVLWLPKTRDDESFKFLMMINPKILDFSKETCFDEEWCLSVPWVKETIERPKNIKVEFYDEKNTLKILILEWLQARIVQHELDHINWKLFIDYLK